jgi:hypothetical protein
MKIAISQTGAGVDRNTPDSWHPPPGDNPQQK